ncbi:hypothetical protein BCV69DRAFT_300029 [Microstroma glucosiphilum]|uniref:Uncharacterized protein n=1 Tax=Pseudomicrostroma glucosiphilum TaxID=1684307 RepID=A0A316U3G3_9BASI|nr:hypothetical protein BCV69DRAFT_300029 [Pseudomicrostroma glucosiphilum]PWN19720.1 hypothetical protein BCV69DRAFT_300029 [Pseudomicrostroma glucosiphilum]
MALAIVSGIDALPTGLSIRGLESADSSFSGAFTLERRVGSNNGPGDSDEQPGLADPGSGGDDSGTGSGPGPGNGGKQPKKSKGQRPRDGLTARSLGALSGGAPPGFPLVTAKPHDEAQGGKKSDSYGRRAELEDLESSDFSARNAVVIESRIASSGGPGDDTGDDSGSDTGSSGGSSGRSSDGTGAGPPNGGKHPGKVKTHKPRGELAPRDLGISSGGAPPGFPSVIAKPHNEVKGGKKGDSYGRRSEVEARGDLPADLPYPFPPIKKTPHVGNDDPKNKSKGGSNRGHVVGS